MAESMKRIPPIARLRVAERNLARRDRSLVSPMPIAWRLHRRNHPLAEYRVQPRTAPANQGEG